MEMDCAARLTMKEGQGGGDFPVPRCICNSEVLSVNCVMETGSVLTVLQPNPKPPDAVGYSGTKTAPAVYCWA